MTGMKLTSVIFATVLSLLALTTPTSSKTLDCKHGFWIFGRDHIYLSHKPEIGSECHGYQVVLEISLDDKARATYRALEAKKGEMTMEFPKHFLLDQIRAGQPMPVKATLHAGNYEDKKLAHHEVAAEINVRVVRKILFRKLSQLADSGQVNVFVFGTPEETYLTNRVDQNPDFDEIVQIETASPRALISKGEFYPLPHHKYAKGGKPKAFLLDKEQTDLEIKGERKPFRVVRKIELTQSDDSFAASH
jgi:hypothetical protein